MTKDTIISLYDTTGNAVRPWAETGYHCYCFDIQNDYHMEHFENGSITFIQWDAFSEPTLPANYKDVAFVSCFPPCTDLAVSGARWFQSKEEDRPGTRSRAMQLVHTAYFIAEALKAPYYIENPVSVISSQWRKPDHSFHPYQYTGWCEDDNYTKKTCLWVGGGFVMPGAYKDDSLGEPDDRIHKAPPGPERTNFRSATPMGFARAVHAANGETQ